MDSTGEKLQNYSGIYRVQSGSEMRKIKWENMLKTYEYTNKGDRRVIL